VEKDSLMAPLPPKQTWPSPFDYSADPVLQQVVAAQNRAVRDAEARALAERQALAVDYGDPELARQLGLGASFEQAASENPFSQTANLRRAYEQQQTATNEALNKRNLFYSSTRGQALGDLATGYQQAGYGASREAQARLAGITENLLGAQMQSASTIGQAQGQAAQRAIDRALAVGYNPASGLAPGEFMGQIRNLSADTPSAGVARRYRKIEREIGRQGIPETRAQLNRLLRAARQDKGQRHTPYRDILQALRRRR
jgi:hypothetical protein